MMQVQHQNNKRDEEYNNRGWPKFFLCVGLFEIIIAVIAATGMGLNVLASSNGVADVKLLNTSVVIGQYYAHVAMETDGYRFTGSFENATSTDHKFYSYKTAYQDNCGNGMPSTSSSGNCNLRYAVWQWTRAYTALGTIATIVVFITGVVLLFLSCCAGLFDLCCGNDRDDNNKGCCRSLFSCTAELWLWLLNILVFILFAFSWAIILGLKFNNHLKTILAQEANKALNSKSSIETYDFTFHTIKVGKSLWPLAVASLLSLIVAMYLMIMICFTCCRSCQNCDDMMRCNETRNYNNHTYHQTGCKTSNNTNKRMSKVTTVETVNEDVQV
jgi:hypothetical protein